MDRMERDRVLVIDDDPDLRDLVSVMLEEWGLTAILAENCTEAMPLLERERSRLRAVLLDYFMPGMTPVQCTETILVKLDPGVPLVLMSAAVDIAARAREVGITHYLPKPFEPEDLRAAVGASAGPRVP